MASGPIKLHVADVQTAVPASVGVEAGMVVLTEDDLPNRSLRIIIGQPEARAILAAWQGATPGRPSTWDLYVSTVTALGARIDRAVLTAVQEERHYFAVIELEHEGERRTLSCRPSDAIALALRAYSAGIMAEPSVLDAAGVLPDGSKLPPVTAPSIDDREAAVAAREAELAARELALADRERATGAANVTEADDVTEAADPPGTTEAADATGTTERTDPGDTTGTTDRTDPGRKAG